MRDRVNVVPEDRGYVLAGAVPIHPRTVELIPFGKRDPRAYAAVIAGQTVDRRGRKYAWVGRVFRSRDMAVRAVELAGGKVVS